MLKENCKQLYREWDPHQEKAESISKTRILPNVTASKTGNIFINLSDIYILKL